MNTNSEAYYLNEDRQGETAVPKGLGSEPKWEEVSKSGRYEWHDHRMHWMGAGDPPNLTDKGKETVIYPRLGDPDPGRGTAGTITGTLTWVPLEDGGLPMGAIFGFAALIIVLSIAVIIVRRRRASGGGDGTPGAPGGEEGARGGVVRRARSPFAALAARAAVPAVASAHATLQATIPKRGEKLDAAPGQVVFRFDEPVEAAFGALRVFDAEGNEVQTGEAFHPGGRGAEIAIKLKPGLGDGAYTATYRVVSADGHAISSGFVFSVGDSTAPARVARDAAGRQRHRPGRRTPRWPSRAASSTPRSRSASAR